MKWQVFEQQCGIGCEVKQFMAAVSRLLDGVEDDFSACLKTLLSRFRQ